MPHADKGEMKSLQYPRAWPITIRKSKWRAMTSLRSPRVSPPLEITKQAITPTTRGVYVEKVSQPSITAASLFSADDAQMPQGEEFHVEPAFPCPVFLPPCP